MRSPHALTALALLLAAGSASAQTFNFANTCGTGNWYSVCEQSPGVWRNNWGEVGPNSFSVAFPAAANPTVLSGVVTLDLSASVASVTVPVGATLRHLGGTLQTTGGVINNGTVDTAQNVNRWLVGPALNNAQWVNGTDNSYWFIDASSLTNNGSLTLNNNGFLQRWNGPRTNAVFANAASGTVNVPGDGTAAGFAGLTLQSGPNARWNTSAGAQLRIVDCSLAGTFTGNFIGTATIEAATLAADATLTTVASSSTGWNLTAGTLDAAGFTATIGGKFESRTAANRWLKGNFVTLPLSNFTIGATGTLPPLYFLDAATLTTNGTLTLAPGASIARWNTTPTSHLLDVRGTLVATSSGHSISGISLNAGPQNTFVTSAGADLTLSDLLISGSFNGNHAGTATLSNLTAVANTSLATGNGLAWQHRNTLNADTFTITNNGRLDSVSNTNRWFRGNIVNSFGGTLTIGGTSPTYFLDAATLTNQGLVVLQSGGGIQRWNAAATDHTLAAAAGTIAVRGTAGSNSVISGITLTSTPGATWTTDAGTTLTFSECRLSGTFRGNHAGTGDLGSFTASGNVILSNTGATTWSWTGGAINSSPFTLTNTGRIDATSATQIRRLAGTTVNAAGAQLTVGSGVPFYFEQLNLTNSGAINLTSSGSISLWSGTTAANTLVNNGTIDVSGPAASTPGIYSITLTNNGLINLGSNLSFIMNGTLFTQAGGNFRAGTGTTVTVANPLITGGRFEMPGTITGGGGTLALTGGTLAPGLFGSTTAATLTLNQCRYSQGPSGTLEISVVRNGLVQQADQVNLVNGFNTAVLDGTLRVNLPAEQPPLAGVEYVIVNAPEGLTGTFAQVTEADPIAGIGYRLRYTPTQALMRIVRKCNLADVAGPGQFQLFDGEATADDIIVFLNWYFGNDSRADIAGPGQTIGADGQFTADDIIVFLNLFFSGCGL